MKFQKTLMIFLIVSELSLNSSFATDTENSPLSPQVEVLTKSVKLELPLPVSSERQKFIINVTSDNGYICHNYLREREIKDKLFSLQAKNDTIPELEKKLLAKEKPTSLIETSNLTSGAIGASLGLILGFFIVKK